MIKLGRNKDFIEKSACCESIPFEIMRVSKRTRTDACAGVTFMTGGGVRLEYGLVSDDGAK